MAKQPKQANTKQFHKKLLTWYANEKRDLPWRRSKDPYRIWISEIMLQQTRVEAVIPFYERFLSHFPNVEALANAEMDHVLNLWTGLGYYSRARNIKAAAEAIYRDHKNQFPKTFTDLRSLKGIGPYTAAAIASIAFDQPHAAIDGNLERVFSRLLALKENPKTTGKNTIQEFGDSIVKNGNAGDLNQAVMDLSAKICLPKEPRCEECPLSENCEAKKQNLQKEIPFRPKKAKPIELKADGLIIIAEDSILLARRARGEWLQGMWDIPWWIREKKPFSLDALTSAQHKGLEKFSECAQTRTITKHKISFHVHGLKSAKKIKNIEAKFPATASEYRWVPISELHGVHLPRPSEKALEETLRELN